MLYWFNNSLLSIQGVQMGLTNPTGLTLDGLVVVCRRLLSCVGFGAACTTIGWSLRRPISQTIRALEQRVGAPLLSRTHAQRRLDRGRRTAAGSCAAGQWKCLSLGLDAGGQPG